MRNTQPLLLIAILALALSVRGQNQAPDDVYSIGKTNFAFYSSKNKTQVMSRGFPVFDNSRPGFGFVHGAQRVELYLLYEFQGQTLTQEPSAITIEFESRSSVGRLNAGTSRTFKIVVDDRTVVDTSLWLEKSTEIGLVTWQQASYQLPMAKLKEICWANRSVVLIIGGILYSLTTAELETFKDFAEALRLGDSTDWRQPHIACPLLDNVGLKTGPYIYRTNEFFACSSSSKGVPPSFANSLSYHAAGDQRVVKTLTLTLHVNDLNGAIRSHESLVIVSGVLANRSVGIKLPNMLLLSLLTGKPYSWSLGKNNFEVTREENQSGQGYAMKFIIW